jgi:hypothetical protein
MRPSETNPTVLTFYAYTLALCTFLLCRGVPLPEACTQAALLASLASFLVNHDLENG